MKNLNFIIYIFQCIRSIITPNIKMNLTTPRNPYSARRSHNIETQIPSFYRQSVKNGMQQ